MKRLTVLLASACLLVLALAGPAVAQPPTSRLSDVSTPTVSAILPAVAPNDRDTPVVVSGSGFLSGATATLGTTPLTAVVVVSDTTLTATVPPGISPGPLRPHGHQPRHRHRHPERRLHRHPAPHGERHRAGQAPTNDIDTSVTISGTDFAADAPDGPAEVTRAPP